MTDTAINQVTNYLDAHQITYVLHRHPALFTTADAAAHAAAIPGKAAKNLLLRNKQADRYLLVTVAAEKKLDPKKLAELEKTSRLSFASPPRLLQKLGVTPGAVSPFGLLNNTEADVLYLIDSDVFDAPIVNFHPNDNTASLELTQQMFQRYLESVPHSWRVASHEVMSSSESE